METTEGFLYLLRSEFERRCKNNSRYSLRAYANYLEVEPSFLSKILNQKRSLTANSVYRFGFKLGLEPEQLERHVKSLKNKKSKRIARQSEYTDVDLDSFVMISDWYHYAILELCKCSDFQSDANYVASKLEISFGEAMAAIERLKRLNMLEEIDGKLQATGNFSTTSEQYTKQAFRNLQFQILDQAKEAMEKTEFDLRSQSSMTMAISTENIPKAKKLIDKFRRDITKLLENAEEKDAVYQLGVSLFPVSHHKDLIKKKKQE